MELIVFAKKGTDEKAVIAVPDRSVCHRLQVQLAMEYGGNWVFVDSVKGYEFIKFRDNFTYRGAPDPDAPNGRYSAAINHLDVLTKHDISEYEPKYPWE